MYSPSKRNDKIFDFAKKMACLSNYGNFRHGAVVVKHGAIMSAGHNKDRPTTFGSRFRTKDKGEATIHAELSAILNIPRSQTEGSDVYVVRINREQELRLSKPCEMCQAAMKFVGIKRVFYSTNDNTFEMMRL
jgi:tRNA(Arg) A34 adenosine deaminase TadA